MGSAISPRGRPDTPGLRTVRAVSRVTTAAPLRFTAAATKDSRESAAEAGPA